MWGAHHPGERDPRPPDEEPPPPEWGYRTVKVRVRGAALGLPVSGPGSIALLRKRLVGWILDGLILLPWFLFADIVIKHARHVTETRSNGITYHHLVRDHVSPMVSLLILAPAALYVIGLIAVRGRTLGQQIMGLRMVRLRDVGALATPDPTLSDSVESHWSANTASNQAPTPGWQPAMIRWLVLGSLSLVAAFTRVPWFLTLGAQAVVFGWAYWDADGQGLHDKAARVVVVTTR